MMENRSTPEEVRQNLREIRDRIAEAEIGRAHV